MSSASNTGAVRSERGQVQILLAGFLTEEAAQIRGTLARFRWNCVAISNPEEAVAVFAREWFDLTLVDVGAIQLFAPLFIQQLRSGGGTSSNSAIVAVDQFMPQQLATQLIQAGADLVVRKPTDPKGYVSSFTEASVLRLQALGSREPENEH